MEELNEEVVESKKGLTGRSEDKPTILIPGEIESVSKRGVTVATGTVYDYKQNKFQQDINEELIGGVQQVNNYLNGPVTETLSEHSNKLEEIDEALEENIPYVIVYDSQTINIPCDPYGDYTGNEDKIGTLVRLYRGNIVQEIAVDGINIIEPSNPIFNTYINAEDEDKSAFIFVSNSNVSSLSDNVEVTFSIKDTDNNFYYGKVIFNKVKQGKSAYEVWKDAGNEGSVEVFLASLKESGFTTKAVLTRPSVIADIDNKTIYAVPNSGDDTWSEYIYVGDMSADYNRNDWLLLATHDGSGLSGALADIDDLKSRNEPIVFTESKEMNAFIKHLFVDVSECSVSYDVTNLYVSFTNNVGGTVYINIWDALTGGNSLTGSISINKGKGIYCSRIYNTQSTYRNKVYFYVEVNEELLPQSSIQSRAKLTSWCFSQSCDARKKDSGITENPLVNKYLTALYVDLTDYIGEFEEIKNGLRLYGLWNSIAQNNQYYLGFMDANGNQRQLCSSNTKPSTILDKSFNISDKGKLRIVAKVNWEDLAGNIWGSQSLRLNPCVFEKEYFYAIIEQPEGGDGDSDVITIDSLKSQFSTRVFTKSASHNQIIKKLFIDASGYTGDADLSEGICILLLAKQVSGTTWGIRLGSVKDNSTLATAWAYSAVPKQEKTVDGIYLYAEYDWDAFPEDTSKQYGPALLTNEAFNPINDPRKSIGYNNLSDEVREMLNGQGGSGGDGAITPLTGGVYGCIGDSITEGAGVQTILQSGDTYSPISGTAKPTYGYLIAKANRMSWHNYGISGSTLGDVTANGVSRNGFAKANGRYTQLAANLTHISIFFGWNDYAYGHVMKREDWLFQTYGIKIYYPSSSSLIGTTHTDGTPYTTQAQYDACNAVTGTVDGVTYNNSAEYWRALYIGSSNDNTPDTFWGAWNIVLKYIIENYPLAKILLIVPYLSASGNSAQLLQETVRKAAHKYGLCVYDFNKKDGQLFAYGWYAESAPEGNIGNLTIRQFRSKNEDSYPNDTVLMHDGAHPNENGYKYMYPSINAKLCSI